MDLKDIIHRKPDKLTFKSLLLLVAVLYIGVYFLTGNLLTQLPTNWFTSWLGGVFSLMDEHGFVNVWSGQSPGFHYFYYLAWKPAQLLSGDQWYFAGVFSLFWYFWSIGALFVSVYFFYKIMEHLAGEQKAIVLGLVYTTLFLTFEWFKVVDSIAIAALLGAVYYCLKGSVKTAGILLGIGAIIKPFGLLVLPVVLRSEFLTLRKKILFSAASLASFGALLLPFIIGNFNIFMSSFRWQSGRPPWETVYALALKLTGQPVPADPFFQDYSGIAQRDWGWTGITPIHSMMTTTVPDYQHWYGIVFMLLAGAAVLALFYFKRFRSEQEFIWGILFVFLVYFALFYGWSANFFFWLAPFFLICLPISFSFLLRLLVLIEYPLLYGLYLAHIAPDLVTSVSGLPASLTSALAPLGIGYWVIIIARTLLFLAVAWLAWKKLATQPLLIPLKVYCQWFREFRAGNARISDLLR